MWFSTRAVASTTYSISSPSFLHAGQKYEMGGCMEGRVRDTESRNRGSELSIIDYVLACSVRLRFNKSVEQRVATPSVTDPLRRIDSSYVTFVPIK